MLHYVKSVRIRSFSGSYFPAFVLNTEICRENLGKTTDLNTASSALKYIKSFSLRNNYWYLIVLYNFLVWERNFVGAWKLQISKFSQLQWEDLLRMCWVNNWSKFFQRTRSDRSIAWNGVPSKTHIQKQKGEYGVVLFP